VLALALEAVVEAAVLEALALVALALEALADEAAELEALPPQPASTTARAMAIARTATLPNVFMMKPLPFRIASFLSETSSFA